MSSTHTYCPFHIKLCRKKQRVLSMHDKGVKVSYDANCECMVQYMMNRTALCIWLYIKRFTVHYVLDNLIENTALLKSISYTNEVNEINNG